MAVSKTTKKASTKKSTPAKKSSSLSPAPKPAPEPVAVLVKKETDWDEVKKSLYEADNSLSQDEISLLVNILAAPRRKRGSSPNGWLSEALRSLIV